MEGAPGEAPVPEMLVDFAAANGARMVVDVAVGELPGARVPAGDSIGWNDWRLRGADSVGWARHGDHRQRRSRVAQR